MKKLFLIPLFCVYLIAGCVNYNNTCKQGDSTVIGHSEVLFDLRPELLRSREAPIGNLVADSLFYAANNQAGAEADFAIVPASVFKTNAVCGTRDFIERGDITKGDLAALFGSESIPLVTIETTAGELKKILESSVSALGDPLAEPEAINFLQVSSQLSFTVDCKQQAHLVAADGSEYAGMRIDNSLVLIGQKGHEITLENWNTSTPIYIVTTKALANSSEGAYSLATAATIVANLEDDLATVAENYITDISPITEEKLAGGRIRLLDNCYNIK